MKRHHTTIVLLTLFITGLLVLWWADYTGVETNEQRERRGQYVLASLADVDDAAVRKIEIDDSHEKIVLERRGRERWQMTKPVDVAADSAMVSTLARNLKVLRKSPDAGSITGAPKTYGLDPPRATVLVYGDNPNKPLATLVVGSEIEGLKDRLYVRPRDQAGNDRPIEIVDGRMLNFIGKPASDWRDKTLFNTPTFYISELAVTGPGRDLKAKREERHWQIVSPINAPADEEKMEGVLAEISSLRVAEGAKGYVADNVRDLAPYGLDHPELTLTLKTSWGGGETQVVQIGKPAKDQPDLAYAKQQDQDDVVLVSVKELRDLGKGKNALRSKRVANLNPARAGFIELHAFDRDFRLARSSAGWTLLGPKPEKTDKTYVENLLRQLAEAQTSDFFEPSAIANSKPSLDPPKMTVKVWELASGENLPGEPPGEPPKEAPAVNLEIGRLDPLKKTLFARIAGDTTVLALTEQVANALPRNVLSFRDRTVLALPPARVAGLSVVRGGETYVLEAPSPSSKSLHWRMTRPIEATADDPTATGMLLTLANLRAEDFITDQPGDGTAYGLDKPTLTASWTLLAETGTGPAAKEKASAATGAESQSRSGTLKIGARVPRSENVYASVTGSPMVFTLGPEALQPFHEEFRNHRVLSIPPEKIEKLTLRWPDRELAFVHEASPTGRGMVWKPVLGLDASGFDVSRINSLVASLAELNTPKFVQYVGIFPVSSGLNPPRLQIELLVARDKDPRILRIGNKSPEGPLLATTDTKSAGAIFLLSGPAWAELVRSPKKPGDLPKNELPEDVFAPGGPPKPSDGAAK
jgi:hypothetical protein